jgi:uncharacterized membrane protein
MNPPAAVPLPLLLDAALALLALAAALALRPWRALPRDGVPWPWLAWLVALPLLWSADRLGGAGGAMVQPISGACLLLLMAGWPLAVLGLAAAAALTAALADLGAAQALSRYVWLGLVPATLALGLGAAVRHWLPRHLFVYILGRGFFATGLAATAAGALALWLAGGPPGLDIGDVLIARLLTASGDAFITGMVVAIFVAYRPQWLATYADRLYLEPAPRA